LEKDWKKSTQKRENGLEIESLEKLKKEVPRKRSPVKPTFWSKIKK